jgi:hypothetical protein
MKVRLIVTAISAAVVGLAGFAGFHIGWTAGARESLLTTARSDLLLEINIAKTARQHGLDDALRRLDSHINSLIMEIEQLSEAASAQDQASSSKALEIAAVYRESFQDASSAGNNPSAVHVEKILSRYRRQETRQ